MCVLPRGAGAQEKALVSSPACGSSLPAGSTMTWSSVPGADAYYLYVGTQPGLNDLVNTGEIQSLTYTVGALPSGTVYARIWVKYDGVWRFSDCTFTVPPPVAASFTFPSDGVQLSGAPTTFRWTSVAGALAYYLYVGTTSGTKDVVDSAETLQTSYSATLPSGRQLYARIWTKYAYGWVFDDVAFTTAVSPPATLIAPSDGATIPGGATAFQWTASPGALAYYLYVGSSVGSKDVIDTGEVSTTSTTQTLPVNASLHARIWTKFQDHWDFRDAAFSTNTAVWVWPRDGARNVSAVADFKWAPLNGAAYDLAIGTALNRSDVLAATGLTSASRPQVVLPADEDLYARLTVHANGTIGTANIHFRTAGLIQDAWSAFAFPADGMTGVGTSTRIEWTPVAGALSYYLYLGTRPGTKDVLDYGEVQNTSVDVSSLPSGPLFARIWTRLSSGWKYSDIVFSTVDGGVQPAMAYPSAGDTQPVNPDFPFQWLPVPGAVAYQLQLGTAAGLSDLLDTGSISLTRRFVGGLGTGTRVYGRVGASVDGQWLWTSFSFQVAAPVGDPAPRVDAALALTGEVRAMADATNVPTPGSVLARLVADAGRTTALCNDYSAALIQLLTEAAAGLSADFVNVCFNTSNAFDCHTVVGVTDSARGVALVLDPTMGFSPVRLSTRQFASADDIGSSAATQVFDDLGFHFVSPQTDAWARAYYLDYPLLYLSRAPGHSPLELMEQVGTSVSSPNFRFYAVQCMNGTAAADIDGTLTTLPCAGAEDLTHVFFAQSISPAAGAGIVVWQPLRFVFQ
jgi:hypothetical protein